MLKDFHFSPKRFGRKKKVAVPLYLISGAIDSFFIFGEIVSINLKSIMSKELSEMIEREIESRARVLAAEMLAAQAKPQMPSDIAPNGELITPYVFDGEKILTSQQVQALLGVQYPALWQMNKDGRLKYRKAGSRILYNYEDVKNYMRGGGLRG